MTTTSRLGLQLWPAGITQADVPANDNALQLDATLGLSVVSATTAAQPGSPTAGQVYILPASPTGTNWAGQATGTIAIYTTAWYFFAPKAGYTARVADTGQLVIYTSAWVNVETLFGSKGTDVASATTTDIGAATGNYVHVTGTTTITGLGTVKAGILRTVRFAGILTLTHNATSLILPTGANITTAANDVATFVSEGSGNWRCTGYIRADGTALAVGGAVGEQTSILFTEGAAPATPAAGKVIIYAKTDGSMYQKDDAGTETALGSAGAGGDYSFVGSAAVSGSAATTFSISGLDLATDGEYLGSLSLENATGSAASISLYYNADTTATNYYQQFLSASSTSVSASRGNTGLICGLNANSVQEWWFTIKNDRDGRPRASITVSRHDASGIETVISSHIWNSVTNVTGITLSSSVASSFAIGSTIKIWKRTV